MEYWLYFSLQMLGSMQDAKFQVKFIFIDDSVMYGVLMNTKIIGFFFFWRGGGESLMIICYVVF